MSSHADMVAQLRKTFRSGKTKDLAWRREQLEQLRTLCVENHEEITAAVRADLGGNKLRGVGEVSTAPSCDWALDHLEEWAEETVVAGSVHKQCVRPEPKGVVLIIAPWNFPITLLLSPLVSAIAAGNVVVLKPSELVPNCEELSKRLVEKYMDPDCIKVVTGGGSTVESLLDQRWDHIFYTGGGSHAETILTKAAKHLTPVTLELGGKSATIVDKSAQMDAAVDRISLIKWMNSGQICVSPDYILCHESRVDEFTRRMKDCIKTSFGANPKESPDFGKIGTEGHVDRLKNLIQTSGGEVICGGVSEIDKSARYVPPTLIKGVSPDAPILKEEIFGPVLPILTFQDMDEAVEKANNISDCALAMYVFSEDRANIDKALTQIESGGAAVNTVLEQLMSELMPFGGKGASGYGKYHGKYGFDEFSHLRAVVRKSTLPGMRASFAPLPVADKPVPDFVYTIAMKVTFGVLPGPLKRLMRQRTLRKMTKLALAAAVFWTFGPRIREFMEFVGA